MFYTVNAFQLANYNSPQPRLVGFRAAMYHLYVWLVSGLQCVTCTSVLFQGCNVSSVRLVGFRVAMCHLYVSLVSGLQCIICTSGRFQGYNVSSVRLVGFRVATCHLHVWLVSGLQCVICTCLQSLYVSVPTFAFLFPKYKGNIFLGCLISNFLEMAVEVVHLFGIVI